MIAKASFIAVCAIFAAVLGGITITITVLDQRLSAVSKRLDVMVISVTSNNSTMFPPTYSERDVEIARETRQTAEEYQVTSNQLLKRNDVLVKDVQAEGLHPIECGFDGLSTYLATDKLILFEEGCGEVGGILWSYDFSTKKFIKLNVRYRDFGRDGVASLNRRYKLDLGKADADGEVRHLIFKDFVNNKEVEVGKLAHDFTYEQTISDFDGSPVSVIDWPNDDSVVRAEVYDARVQLADYGDVRKPILTKVFYPQAITGR